MAIAGDARRPGSAGKFLSDRPVARHLDRPHGTAATIAGRSRDAVTRDRKRGRWQAEASPASDAQRRKLRIVARGNNFDQMEPEVKESAAHRRHMLGFHPNKRRLTLDAQC
jgi:hypothetical protein